MAVMWIVFVIFAILSAVLLAGKGGFLIAGYNTSSKEQQAKYDEKKLCRVTGAGMAVITVMIGIMALLDTSMPEWFVTFFTVATLVICVVLIYVTNTKCFAKDYDKNEPKAETTEKNSKVVKYSLIFTAVVFAVCFFLLVTGDIEMEYGEDSVTVVASYWSDQTISYDDIDSIEYREEFSGGSRVGGFGSLRLLMGNFRNDEFSNYTRYTYTDCDSCIVLSVKGKTIVIGGKDEKSTQEIYQKLSDRIK